jgi:hypothetical protein
MEEGLKDEEKKSSKIEKFRVSLNALAKIYTYNTIKTICSCKGNDLIILINSGNTHSFINEYVIKGCDVVIRKTNVLVVAVVNRNVMLCDA